MVALWQLLLFAILKPYSTPAEFGLFILISTGVSFLSLSGDFGVSTYVFYKKLKSYESLKPFLNFNKNLGIVIALISGLGIGLALYGVKFSILSTVLFGISIFFSIIQKSIKSVLELNQKYSFLCQIEVYVKITSIFFAYIICYYTSNLFLSASVAYFSNSVFSYSLMIYKMRSMPQNLLCENKVYAIDKSFFNYCGIKTLDTVLAFMTRNIDLLIVGYFYDLESVGMYGLLKTIIAKPTPLITQAVNKTSLVQVTNGSSLTDSLERQFKLITIFSIISYLVVFLSMPILSKIYDFKINQYNLLILGLFVSSFLKNFLTITSTPIITQGLVREGLKYSIIQVILFIITGFIMSYNYTIDAFPISLIITNSICLVLGYYMFLSKYTIPETKTYILSIMVASLLSVMLIWGSV